jgi:SAM-dependent methyltransferase
VRAYINRLLSGDPGVEWLAWIKRDFLKTQLGLALSLCCGEGYTEREARRLGLFREIEGFDASEEALRRARQLAREQEVSGLTYRCLDLDQLELEPGRYDAVVAKAALHHLRNLEGVLSQVERTLKSRGWLLVNEYVGPSRFQWTERQLLLINELLQLLPERYRTEGGPGGPVKQAVSPPSPAQLEAEDPSEAARSAEIFPLLEARFEVAARRDLGGTLLHMLLRDIVSNFDPSKEEDRALLDLLIHFEEVLLREKALPSDHVAVVARKRS